MKKHLINGLSFISSFFFIFSVVSADSGSFITPPVESTYPFSVLPSPITNYTFPYHTEITGEGGETVQGMFEITNYSDTDQIYYTSLENVDGKKIKNSPASWMTVPGIVKVNKKSKLTSPYWVTFPEDAYKEDGMVEIKFGTTTPAGKSFYPAIVVDLYSSRPLCSLLTKSLTKGQENGEVLSLQQFLFNGGYLTTKPTGFFDSGTVTALKKLQVANGIPSTGTVGKVTRGKVNDVYCKTMYTTSSPLSGGVASATKETLIRTRNSQRFTDIGSIELAITQYLADHNLKLPKSVTSRPKVMCTNNHSSCKGMIEPWLTPKYLTTIPIEPGTENTNGSGYLVSLSDKIITISAQYAEGGRIITRSFVIK